MDTKTYQKFTELPEYLNAAWDGDKLTNRSDTLPLWSGKAAPPAIGSFAVIQMNNTTCRVAGYFVEDGWLGLLVEALDPPEWYIRQNGFDCVAHVFGAEVKTFNVEAPQISGPNLEQLTSLQAFATKYGEKKWKKLLNDYWMNGRDAAEPNGHLLRQVRNQFGPQWLHSDANKVVPKGQQV